MACPILPVAPVTRAVFPCNLDMSLSFHRAGQTEAANHEPCRIVLPQEAIISTYGAGMDTIDRTWCATRKLERQCSCGATFTRRRRARKGSVGTDAETSWVADEPEVACKRFSRDGAVAAQRVARGQMACVTIHGGEVDQ